MYDKMILTPGSVWLNQQNLKRITTQINAFFILAGVSFSHITFTNP